MKHNYQRNWRRQKTIQEGIVIAAIVAFATVLFVGAIRIMAQVRSPPVAAESAPAVQTDDDYDEASVSEDGSGE